MFAVTELGRRAREEGLNYRIVKFGIGSVHHSSLLLPCLPQAVHVRQRRSHSLCLRDHETHRCGGFMSLGWWWGWGVGLDTAAGYIQNR